MDKVSKLLRLTPAMADRIKRCRHANRISSEAEAIRMLLSLALDTVELAEQRSATARASGHAAREPAG